MVRVNPNPSLTLAVADLGVVNSGNGEPWDRQNKHIAVSWEVNRHIVRRWSPVHADHIGAFQE